MGKTFSIYLKKNTTENWMKIEVTCGVQYDTDSCGIFTLMHAESVLSNTDPILVKSRKVAAYRKKIKVKLTTCK